MFNRSTRLRLHRILRRRQQQVESLGQAAEDQFDHNLIGRFGNLRPVRRFVVGWLLLAVVLIVGSTFQTLALSGYYQSVRPTPGGVYTEGIVGTYSNVNPIYATGAVNVAVAHLIFAGLMTYNDQNELVGNLATGYEVDASGKQYTVHLRPGLTWQDGQPLTAEDVAFTYELIQNPDAASPLLNSWKGITVTAKDAMTVEFGLPNPLSSFPYSLTTGIVPKHILQKVPANHLRSSSFNTTAPVGAGPFAWKAIQVNGNDPATSVTFIALDPFAGYHSGAPRLGSYVIKAFNDNAQMVKAFQARKIDGMAGLNEVPKELKDDEAARLYSFPMSAAVMTFFKTSAGVLSDVPVRQALVQAANVPDIIKSLGYKAQPVQEPLLTGQLSYDGRYLQAGFNPQAAAAVLDKDGWVAGADGLRSKGDQPLAFDISAQDTPENRLVLKQLVRDWRQVGARVTPVLQTAADFQSTLEFHSYDALLYGISIGLDPDVFAYWDSSQADVRSANQLNFSEYKSATADAALEAGRTRSDPQLRTIKYQPFLQAWQADAPALALYQPRFLYITHVPIAGLRLHTLNSDTDRYNSVANWEVRTTKVTN